MAARMEAQCAVCDAIIEITESGGSTIVPRHNVPDTRFPCPSHGTFARFDNYHVIREPKDG